MAFELWGYKSGAGNQIAAALKAYGLAEFHGKTDKREIRISEAGRRILLDAPEKSKLLKEAALKPSLHAELWKKYGGELPPANIMIRQHLLLDQNFNRSLVDSFISQFRATIAYAGLAVSGKLPDKDKEQDDGEQFVQDEPKMLTLDPNINDSDKAQLPLSPPPKG